MGLADSIPGFAPGKTLRNVIVAGIYLFIGFIVLIVALGILGAFVLGLGGDAGTAAEQPAPDGGDVQTPTPDQSNDLAVRVGYSGEWQGSLSVTVDGGSSSRSISGSGTRTIDVPDDASTVAVNGQKQDNSGGTLTVEIIQGNTVVAQSSTNAEYGVAQVSESFF